MKILFEQPSTYKEMLSKIAIFTTMVSLIYLVFIISRVPELKGYLPMFNINLNLLNMDISLAYAIIPILIGLLSNALHLHNKISDLFKIRFNFDVKYILMPLIKELGIDPNENVIKKVRSNRIELMSKGFYKYASSTNPSIDKHLITKALANWTWFWILIEASLIAIVGLVILVIFNSLDTM